jgi:hypothetical protein
MKLLNEIDRFKSLMGIILEDEKKDIMNPNLMGTINTLTYLDLYSKKTKNMLTAISVLANLEVSKKFY